MQAPPDGENHKSKLSTYLGVAFWIIVVGVGIYYLTDSPDDNSQIEGVQSQPSFFNPTNPAEEENNLDNGDLYFHGYTCTEDCSGHEAGYEWAEENDITDPDDCGGNSQSFIEGCESYAEEYQEGNTEYVW